MFTLNIKNFRSFRDQTFKFSKFNILIGENSSGKSSLLKFLLALKQSQVAPANHQINFLFKGIYTDLGTYKDAVYHHDDSLPIEFSFEFDHNYFQYFKRIILALTSRGGYKNYMEEGKNDIIKNITSPTTVRFVITNELNKHASMSTTFSNKEIGELEIKPSSPNKEQELTLKNHCRLYYYDYSLKENFVFDRVQYDKDGFMTLVVASSLTESITQTIKMDEKFLGNKDIIDTLWHKIAFLIITQNHLNYFTNKFQYINPIDTHPARLFVYQDKKNTESVNDLNDVVDFFTNNDEFSKSIQAEYINILKSLGIADDLNIIHDERLPVRELRVTIKDVVSNIYDVGYGVALQLPIILKALLSERIKERKNSIIFIEQPEVHLHPKLHSQLLSVLLSLSKNTVYFIETHSEHMVRKLQVDVKQGNFNIKPQDVTVHYLKQSELETKVTEHIIEKTGKLIPVFPEGFFDNSFNLAKELLD